MSITVLVILAVSIVLLSETVGLWFFDAKIVIPAGREHAAFWCYQFSVMAFVINLLSIPYNACIVAHERMSTFAYVGLFEGFGKLLIAFYCQSCMPSNQERNVTNLKRQQRFTLGLLINIRFEHFNIDALYHRVRSSFYSTAIKEKKKSQNP